LELVWEHELYRRMLEYSARHVRTLVFDKRGLGLSDRFDADPTLEQRIGDIRAVMDAEGIDRASLIGLSEGGLMAQLFAALCPERVDRLVLINSVMGAKDLPYTELFETASGSLNDQLTRFGLLIDSWGIDPHYFVDWFCPSQSENAGFVRWWGRFERLSATQADFRRQVESIAMMTLEHGADMLKSIQAPTLVIQVAGDRVNPVAVGRLLGQRIRGARYLEVEGDDHFLWVMPTWREVLDHEISFITGAPVEDHAAVRRFAVVLFTDIVDSTSMAANLGDATWRETLDGHDRLTWRIVDRHRGRIVNTTGDGILAIFDTPSAAVACAKDLQRELNEIGLVLRIGLHAGEIEIRDETDIAGLAVHIAARVEQTAMPGQVLLTSTLRDLLLGGGIEYLDAGTRTLKGVDGEWPLYALA
jgi:class 3 adenylate cyclase